MFQFTRPRGARRGRTRFAVGCRLFQFTRPRGARLGPWWAKRVRHSCFNSRARVGRDEQRSSLRGPARGFNSRARVGRDARRRRIGGVHRSFNSRARVGRDKRRPRLESRTSLFQFTRPRGARRKEWLPARSRERFNSRARVGRDSRFHSFPYFDLVSIHAPAWGATSFGLDYRGLANVSIHAPAWGATSILRVRSMSFISFNSRARVGRDLRREATSCGEIAFQFTRPRGARPLHGGLVSHPRRFNSRARVGRDRPEPQVRRCKKFQFTRPRGARPSYSRASGCRFSCRFQFTRPRGARHRTCRHREHRKCFNSRARVGRDFVGVMLFTDFTFQFTRPRGARRAWRGAD